MFWGRSDGKDLAQVVRQSFGEFLLVQFGRPWIYLLFLATLSIYILYGWRGWLRNKIYFEIR